MDTRIFVHKKEQFQVESESLAAELRQSLSLKEDFGLTKYNLYDIFDADENDIELLKKNVCSEVVTDDVYDSVDLTGKSYLAYEFLPGQYDQRADSAMQCLMLLNNKQTVRIHSGTLLVFANPVDEETLNKITHYIVNPVEARVKDLSVLVDDQDVEVKDVPVLEGFTKMSKEELDSLRQTLGLAMSQADIEHVQRYFEKEEKRDCTMTELRVLDTYWSDHCRHTTFETVLDDVCFHLDTLSDELQASYDKYLKLRQDVHGNRKEKTLMDMATIAGKYLRKQGKLDDMEITDEINACSVEITVDVDGKDEQWLLMFKNETHNHPTEIEPFGGAATCLGGAIRDPLSGRAYVYQSMRITGAGDPRQKLEDTLPGKLPQRKICEEAAHGFSSYGNQIGLTTGFVHEVYDQGYVAKRMELGAVVAAAPEEQVKRLIPENGQIVLLIGGRTGRDGIGGATGSSKKHELKTTETAGAEVQKGNPVEERKIQRLFRNKEFSKKIVRCNDFGAGGVSVAVGELAPGLDINLDAVLKKYEGLNGTELAISESQERMAIVINECDKDFCIQAAHDENLEVVQVATVTDKNRLTMKYMGDTIVDISRDFLDEAGAKRYQDIHVELPDFDKAPFNPEAKENFTETTKEVLSRLSTASQKGLVERFDSSIGNGTVLSPFGGKTYRTETEGMAALIPVLGKETTTCSLMSYGYSPLISEWSPYHGAINAVVESVAKIIAMGGTWHTIRFSFQEFFEKLLNDPKRWGKPFSALLGAYRAQEELLLPSIGGKDSMSGSFEDLDVPPTLVSFAITGGDVHKVITPELKEAGHVLVEFMLPKDEFHVFDFEALRKQFDAVEALIQSGKAYSAYTVKDGGLVEAVYKMAFGNEIGVAFDDALTLNDLVEKNFGHIIVEVDNAEVVAGYENVRIIASTNEEKAVSYKGEKVTLDDAYEINCAPLESVYPTTAKAPTTEVRTGDCNERGKMFASKKYDEVNVVIPVFPGTNCEFDSKRAFEKAGAKVQLVLIRNKTEEDIKKSVDELEEAIHNAQIMMLPGGFSAGDEPEGSGKFIATVLRNPRLKAAIDDLLDNREGLMIGICNGFQALVKLGLLPHGHIKDMSKDDPTLTFNTIGRHLSQMVTTRVSSVKSPWLANVELGDEHIIPISHGEGRFVAPQEVLDQLIDNGQVAFQYVDPNGNVTMESPYNPNGSMYGIEGIISEDGRVLGKMGHSERQGENRDLNIYGEMDQKLFEAGVKYFKGE